ncbi:MAG: MaoC/PaaZ C-terminal domain-containing protein [Jatrophihabitantaceae bacterium]
MSTEELDRPPSLRSLYPRAILHRGGGRGELSGHRLRLTDQPIDPDRLWRYQQLCGFRVSDLLPATYPHLLAFPLSMALMTRPDFPFPLLGLIHIGNQISQQRPIRGTERVTVRAWATGLCPHPAGQSVDLVSEALVGDELVWREVSSYLHRERSADRKPGSDRKPDPDRNQHRDPAASNAGPVIRWSAPADIGRRYSTVSGDRNPIHLTGLSAKVFGFRAAIAHGMWLKARTLAAFEGRLPDRFRVEVAFKTPVFLPSTVELQAEPAAPGWQFEVRGVRSGKPHLAGTISAHPTTDSGTGQALTAS